MSNRGQLVYKYSVRTHGEALRHRIMCYGLALFALAAAFLAPSPTVHLWHHDRHAAPQVQQTVVPAPAANVKPADWWASVDG